MTEQKALMLALEALENIAGLSMSMYGSHVYMIEKMQNTARAAIKEARANQALDKKAENARELGLDYEPEQEPVAWMWNNHGSISLSRFQQVGWQPLYTTPPQRPWVGLAAEDRLTAKYMQDAPEGIEAVIDYIEAKLKEKNT